jgi:hypothetical protein
MMVQNIINILKANPRKLFLIDGFGAVSSAFLLGVILMQFENHFGMPLEKLYFLAAVAGVFAIYSLSCYVRFPTNWRPFLKLIAILNLIYSGVTLSLVIYLYEELTILGLIYFLLELVVLIVLVSIELKVAFVRIDD